MATVEPTVYPATIAGQIERLQKAKADLKTAIEGKGVTVSSSTKLDGYADLVDSIETGGSGPILEKDVSFYDFDGSLVESYSKKEFLKLTALPKNPDHTSLGLTSQGWNWTLSNAKTYVTNNGTLKIGQVYNTINGSTHIIIDTRFWSNNTSITLTFTQSVANGVTIDFGDNTPSITSANTSVTVSHTYLGNEIYTIKLTPIGSCTITISGDYTGCTLLGTSNRTLATKSIIGVFIGKQVKISSYAFKKCGNLKYVTISSNIGNSVGSSSSFSDTSSLRCIIMPSGVNFSSSQDIFNSSYVENIIMSSNTTVDVQCFGSCYGIRDLILPNLSVLPRSLVYRCTNLESIVIPTSVRSINSTTFDNCTSLRSVIFPSNIRSIGSYQFSNITSSSALKEIIIKRSTPPTLGSESLGSSSLTCSIYVPDSSVSNYKSTYTTYSSRIHGISERNYIQIESVSDENIPLGCYCNIPINAVIKMFQLGGVTINYDNNSVAIIDSDIIAVNDDYITLNSSGSEKLINLLCGSPESHNPLYLQFDDSIPEPYFIVTDTLLEL